MSQCIWEYNNDSRGWDSDCGGQWESNNGDSPHAEGYHFCPFCGGKLKEKRAGVHEALEELRRVSKKIRALPPGVKAPQAPPPWPPPRVESQGRHIEAGAEDDE